jgi:hypothetical protein
MLSVPGVRQGTAANMAEASDLDPTNPYSASKAVVEMVVKICVKSHGLPAGMMLSLHRRRGRSLGHHPAQRQDRADLQRRLARPSLQHAARREVARPLGPDRLSSLDPAHARQEVQRTRRYAVDGSMRWVEAADKFRCCSTGDRRLVWKFAHWFGDIEVF